MNYTWEKWDMGGGGHWAVADIDGKMVIMSDYSGDMCMIPFGKEYFSTEMFNQLDDSGCEIHGNGDTWIFLAEVETSVTVHKKLIRRIFDKVTAEKLIADYMTWYNEE